VITANRESEPAKSRPGGHVLPSLVTAAALVLTLVIAGCGSSSSGTGVARVPSSRSNSPGSSPSGSKTHSDALAYSACIRKHGVPNFPDPNSSGQLVITSQRTESGGESGVDTNSPQFKRAQHACQSLQPAGGRPSAQQQEQAQQAMLKFAACMRSHGVPKFPDPQVGQPLSVGTKSGVDPASPAFKRAQQTCQKLVPGSPVIAAPPAAPRGSGSAEAAVPATPGAGAP
jgi:hypothetical protein